ncbi:MAG TPA: hypothetical protein VFR94_03760 [Nitrososphaeraceae archaeon]|nr:hypothetical protein [Nitrososphaeraceae archaeon]
MTTPKQRFHKNMENAKGTIVVGIIVAVVGGLIIFGLLIPVGIVIAIIGIHQYRVAKRKYSAALQQIEEKGEGEEEK